MQTELLDYLVANVKGLDLLERSIAKQQFCFSISKANQLGQNQQDQSALGDFRGRCCQACPNPEADGFARGGQVFRKAPREILSESGNQYWFRLGTWGAP
jgi:hypothetical protein